MTPRRHRETPGMGRRILAAAIATALAASLAGTASAAEPTDGPTPAPTTAGATDGTTDGTTCTADASVTWTTATGATLAWNDTDQAWEATADGDATGTDPIDATANTDACGTVSLTPGDITQGTPRSTGPGVATTPVSRTWTGEGPDGGALRLTLTGETTTGKDVTLTDGGTSHAFTQASDGTWHAAVATGLSATDEPDLSTLAPGGNLTLSDGTTVPLASADFTPTSTVTRDGADWRTRTATATTTVTEPTTGTSTRVTIDVTASRVRDTHVTLGVLRTLPDGTTRSIPLDGWDEATTGYAVALPHDAIGDSYTLAVDKGPDAATGTPTARLGDASSRILTLDANGRTYTVTVRFQAADIQPDSTARLDGIYVNRTGGHSQGQLIDGWDPNRLAYTVTVQASAPSPYVLPVAPQGVDVAAAGTRQTADGTTQAWTVTDTATGTSRQYTVTVVRARSYRTAAETFAPADPTAQDPAAASDDTTDTGLDSVGWTGGDGTYHAEPGDSFTIPGGGTFSYRAKDGQSVSVSSARGTGMAWTYTLGVLAADGRTYASHAYTVTYITEATHTAALDGIAVDGTPLNGFDPDTTGYTVLVADPAHWTVAALWDRTTGMTVDIAKDGDTATITVTSADGLTTRTYTVTAATEATVKAIGALAHTGVAAIPMAAAALALAASGSIPGVLRIARRHRMRHAK